jgi:hypothetical protein
MLLDLGDQALMVGVLSVVVQQPMQLRRRG